MMMLLISVFDIVQDCQCLFSRSRFYHDFLETAFQCSILLNTLAIFIYSGGTDALDYPACQCRFHDIGCIHAARSTSGTNHCMDFINENNDIGVLLKFADQ